MEPNIKEQAKFIADKWLDNVFKGSDIEMDENLIEKGLSSIQIMQLSGKLKKNGVRIPFAKLIESPNKESWFSLIDSAKVKVNKHSDKNNKSESKVFPLTDIQYSYLIGREDDQPLGGVGCHAYLEIDGEGIDPEKLNESWNKLQYRHPMLRARFINNGHQEILDKPYSENIETIDLSKMDNEEIEAELKNIRENLSHRKLKVKEGQVADIKLALLPNGKHRIFFDIDLLVADVMSMSILLKELAEIYSSLELVNLNGYTFADYIHDLESIDEDNAEDKKFWETKINSFEIERPNLPIKGKPEQIKETRFIRRKRIIKRDDWETIKEIAASYQTTPSMVLLTSYALVLERWCNQEKFFINIPLFNRNLANENLKDMVADFTNLLLVEHETLNDKTFLDTLKRTNKIFLENVSHSSYSGVQVQRDISKSQGTSVNVAPIVFACNIDYPLETEISGNTLGEINYMISQTPGVWIDFQSYIKNGNLILCWDSVDELFTDGLLDDMFNSLYELLMSLTKKANWEKKVDVLPENQKKVRAQEVECILPLQYPKETIYDGFISNVKLNPSKVALIDSETKKETTYKELYETSLRVTAYLKKHGVKKGDYIGITLPRGSRQIFAIFGILFAGAAYVPIGITQPSERRSKTYDQIGIKHIISDKNTIEECSLKSEEVEILDLDEGISSVNALENIVSVSPYDSAYIIMTSGTTGIPKGVEIMHTSAINTCIDLNKKYKITADDTVLMVSAIDFDLSVYDIFGILHVGGTVITTSEDNYRNPDEWLKLIDDYEVTIWDSVPILFDMLETMAEGKNRKLPFRVVMLSGDWIAIDLPGRFYNISDKNDSVVVAMGGATEASIWSNYLNVPRDIPEDWTSIPYGKPLKNQVYRVVDELGRTCPNYVKGELLIGGVGVAKCYHGDEELTEKKYFEKDGIRWYRTGDNGRIWNDGTIEFLGRKDTQVKVKGHRIELGEIEDAIRKFDGVNKVIVDFIERGGSKHLVAFIKIDKNATAFYKSLEIKDIDRSFLIKPEIHSLSSKSSTQNKGINSIVLKAIVEIFKGIDVDFSKRNYSLDEIFNNTDRSEKTEFIVKQWLNVLVSLEYLKIVEGKYEKKNSNLETKIEETNSLKIIENYVKNLVPELVKIIKNKKEPIEVFYTDDEEFSVINLVKNLVGYKESVESITNSLKNFVEANPNKKLRILEYSTRDSELTYGVFNELKAYVTEYIYVDDSVYYETKLSGLKEHDEFKYVNFNDELKNKFEEDYFDVIIALNSIHRSENAKARAEELISILKPYGLLVGNEINKPNLLPLITADILNTQNFSAENEINIKTDKSEIIYESNADKLAITNFNTFFVRKFKNSKISFDNLKNYLSKEIPGYMIPTYFYHVNEIPLNKNGKADRKKLKNNILKNNAVSNKVLVEQTKPKTETEKTLLNIWKDSLNNEDISINDNYFSVGGDSLTATSITGKVRKELGLEISIKDIFQNSSIAALSEFIDDNMGSLSIKTDSVAIIPDKKHLYEPFPLTDVQMAYWIGRQGAYNLGNVSTHCYFEFDCLNLKISKLQEVLNDMVTYHPALRTIVMKSGEQKILKEVSYFLVNVNDITTLREVIKEEILQQIREELSHRIIDLSQFPTFDFKVARISWNTFRVFIGLDNTILDGWSMFEFLKEIKSRYEGDFNEENIGVTFRDYVLYKNRADNINFERDKVYWLNRLDSFPNMPKLFFMKNDSSKIDQKFNRKEAKIEKEDWLKFKNIATQSEVTPTALLLSLFSVILSKYSNEDNFVINMTQFIKKDVHPQIYKVTGDFTELSLLEIKLDKNNTIIENANKIQHQLISDMEHSSYSSIEFLRELRKQKDVNNIAPIVFTSGLGIKGNRSKDFLGNLNYAISQTPQIWLDHQVIEVDGDLILVWDYVTGIFDNNEIDACFEDYVSIVKEFVINENMQTRYFSELNENHLQNDGVKYSFSEGNVDFKSKDKTSVSLEVENKSDSNGLYYEGLKQEIKGLFKEILELDEIKDDDNFFSLGGNSLNMIQLSNKLLDKYKYQLDFSEFLENATVFYIVSETTKYLMGE